MAFPIGIRLNYLTQMYYNKYSPMGLIIFSLKTQKQGAAGISVSPFPSRRGGHVSDHSPPSGAAPLSHSIWNLRSTSGILGLWRSATGVEDLGHYKSLWTELYVNAGFYHSRGVITKATNLAATNNVKALEALPHEEVEKFMPLWKGR
ncbi:hypothetical protein C1H46_003890 [Malus baccata]|uniref:Uncharacterized protein n=1 Tax=Malus baccata TaxID=106549 RepID=A0A540NHB4_MALBA|nr:hypothetical protein C1H46_003890 [Malus baccata]